MNAQQARELSLGRYWGSANTARLHTYWDGGATINLFWDDGATLTQHYDSAEEAKADLSRWGFAS